MPRRRRQRKHGTLAVADSFRGSEAAATIVVVKALVTPAMREAKPDAAFKGYTDVVELADTIVGLWDKPADEVNGERIWLTTYGQHHDPARRGFASDNYAGVHPEILSALALANGGHVGSYGGDPYTAVAVEVLRGHFGDSAEVFFVFNGTGANVVSLQAMTKRWDAVICAESAHINVDECGAAEKIAGLKLLARGDARREAHSRADRRPRLGFR